VGGSGYGSVLLAEHKFKLHNTLFRGPFCTQLERSDENSLVPTHSLAMLFQPTGLNQQLRVENRESTSVSVLKNQLIPRVILD